MAESVDFQLPPEPEPDVPAPATAVAPTAASLPGGVAARARHWLRLAQDFALLMRLDRPIGIWLLLWPALWALWTAASGHPSQRLLVIFVAGAVLMRSAGCVINDLLDRDIDPHVRRTRERPLAARRVTPLQALALIVVLITSALLLVLQLNAATVRLSLFGAALTFSYPLLKRFFPLPQLYLGLSFGWAVPMAFAAELGAVPRVGWVMMLAAVVWAGVYDTFYAMADRADDLRVGVKSAAITFGDLDLLMIGAMQVLVLLALLFTGQLLRFGVAYYAALAVGAVCFGRQLWLARARDAAGCLRAFHENHYFGLVILAGIIVQYAARS